MDIDKIAIDIIKIEEEIYQWPPTKQVTVLNLRIKFAEKLSI